MRPEQVVPGSVGAGERWCDLALICGFARREFGAWCEGRGSGGIVRIVERSMRDTARCGVKRRAVPSGVAARQVPGWGYRAVRRSAYASASWRRESSR